jgi:hypothetical protein
MWRASLQPSVDLLLMSKIKIDPTNYLKRSDLSPRATDGTEKSRRKASKKWEQRFLTAPIDQAGYVDFRMVVPQRHRRSHGGLA